MTAVLTRSPLQILSMTSTQRTTLRRSARHAFDEDDAPPVKKARVEPAPSQPGSKQANGEAGEKRVRKAKAVYDENDEGFQFSRVKTRRKQSSKAPEVEEGSVDDGRAAAPTAKRKKASTSGAAPVQEELPRRRRSARLSGEKEPATPVLAQAQVSKPRRSKATAKPGKGAARGDGSPEVEAQEHGIRVEKKREATRIALPFADTPVIQRNKDMRKNNGQTHRRSSTGMRGRRASSLIEDNKSNALPHAEVEIKEFYKHIAQDLLEPKRMKQLLVWCGTRAMPEKPSGDVQDTSAIMAARVIQEELLKEFANNPDMSNLFQIQDTTPAVLVKRPNPRNTQNAAKLQELEREIKRLEAEKQAWDILLASSSALPPSDPAQLSPTRSNHPESTSVNLQTSLLPPDQAAIVTSLIHPSESTPPSATRPTSTAVSNHRLTPSLPSSRLRTIATSLEPTIDTFADGVHKISQYRLAAERVADHVLGVAASVLEERDKAVKERSGTAGVMMKDVLGALGGVMAARGTGAGLKDGRRDWER